MDEAARDPEADALARTGDDRRAPGQRTGLLAAHESRPGSAAPWPPPAHPAMTTFGMLSPFTY
ncbi:hypothetical protein GCM10023085_65160 [Actinomadura viridis]